MFNNIVFLLGIALIWETSAQEPEGVLVVNVKATDRADVSFWNTHCSKIPADAAHVKIVMGSVVDYFKPITGSTFCQMLSCLPICNRHQWSPDGENWETPKYHLNKNQGLLGGSAANWPKDGRQHLSFWGGNGPNGGCCHDTNSSTGAWKQSFDLYYEMGLYCEIGSEHNCAECLEIEKRTEVNQCTACNENYELKEDNFCYPCGWVKFEDKYIGNYANGYSTKMSLEDAKAKCLEPDFVDGCGGVTCNANNGECTTRKNNDLDPGVGSTSYMYFGQCVGDNIYVDFANSVLGKNGQVPECGVCSQDGLSEKGFIMNIKDSWFSQEDSRFSDLISGHYAKLVNVRHTDSSGWQYDNNAIWKSFVPRWTDILIAKVDYSEDTCTTLEGNPNTYYKGIRFGYSVGDLECRANQRYANAGSGSNAGEFYVRGDFYEYERTFECKESDIVPLSKFCSDGSNDLICEPGQYFYGGNCENDVQDAPTWIYRDVGVCPDDEHRGVANTGHTIDSCRNKCEPQIEAYFSMWEDQNGEKMCGCYRDCDVLTMKDNGKTYEIVSTTTQAYINLLVLDLQPEFTSRDNQIRSLMGSVASKDNEIEAKENEIESKENEIESKENEIEAKKNDISILQATNLELNENRDLWKVRFEDVQSIENANLASNKALANHPDQVAIGNTMDQCNKGSNSSFMDSLLFLGIGAGLYAFANAAFFTKRKGDEYEAMLEI